MKRFDILTVKRNKSLINGMWIFSVFFYSYSLYITDIDYDIEYEVFFCGTSKRWFDFAKMMAISDSVLTICVPMILIILANILISYELLKSKKVVIKGSSGINTPALTVAFVNDDDSNNQTIQLEKLDSKKISLNVQNSSQSQLLTVHYEKKPGSTATGSKQPQTLTSPKQQGRTNRNRMVPNRESITFRKRISDAGLQILNDFVCSLQHSNLLRRSIEIKRHKKYSKTTRTLVIITFSYFLLNSLMAISKLRYIFAIDYAADVHINHTKNSTTSILSQETNTITNISAFAIKDEISYYEHEINTDLIERLAGYLYYLNYSINFFLYVFSGSEFRKAVLSFFKC